jgi:hypothetical protein
LRQDEAVYAPSGTRIVVKARAPPSSPRQLWGRSLVNQRRGPLAQSARTPDRVHIEVNLCWNSSQNGVYHTHAGTPSWSLQPPTRPQQISPIAAHHSPARIFTLVSTRQCPARQRRSIVWKCARTPPRRFRRAQRRHGRPGAEFCPATINARKSGAVLRELCRVSVWHEYERFLRGLP